MLLNRLLVNYSTCKICILISLGLCNVREWERSYSLPQEMHCLGKALARGSMKSVASSAFNCKGLRPHIEDLVASEISRECKNICSLKNP